MVRPSRACDPLIDEIIANDRFDVREDGTIWRHFATVGWKRVGKTISAGGYYRLTYKGRLVMVHRIVYRKFTGPLDPSLETDHIDDNKLNNVPSNLRQVTGSINNRKRFNLLTDDQVDEIRALLATCKISQHAVAARYGISQATISLIVNGKRKYAIQKGYADELSD